MKYRAIYNEPLDLVYLYDPSGQLIHIWEYSTGKDLYVAPCFLISKHVFL